MQAPRDAAADADIDPASTAGDAARRRHHDADDQSRLRGLHEKTMISAPSMIYSAIKTPLAVALMKLADERIAAGFERPNPHGSLGLAGNDLLDFQHVAFEFLGRDVVVDDRDDHPLVCRHLEFFRRELVVLNRQRKVVRAACDGAKARRATRPVNAKNLAMETPERKVALTKSLKAERCKSLIFTLELFQCDNLT